MGKIDLTVEEGIAYAQTKGYWEGYAAAAGVFAEHAKDLALREILESRKQTPQVAPEPEAGRQPVDPNYFCQNGGINKAVNGNAAEYI